MSSLWGFGGGGGGLPSRGRRWMGVAPRGKRKVCLGNALICYPSNIL